MGLLSNKFALAAIAFTAFAFYLEHSSLRLPGPSFRPVGKVTKAYPQAEQKGVFAPNAYLQKAERRFRGEIYGSETVALSPDKKTLYMADVSGDIWRAKDTQKSKPELVAHLSGGRPLGFALDPNEDIYLCLAAVGLVYIPKGASTFTVIANQAPESVGSKKLTPIYFPNSLTIASNGDIYFSDSMDSPPSFNEHRYYDTLSVFFLGILEGRATGRLLKYSQKDKTVTTLASGFIFANGVQLAKDESFALVIDTERSQIFKVWLKGPKVGSKEVFFSQVPGHPDGLAIGLDNTFWISVVVFDQPNLRLILKTRFTGWLLPKMPASLSKLVPGTALIQISQEGKILRYMADPNGKVVDTISSVVESEKGLFIGNVGEADQIGFLPRSEFPPILA